jgi:hypothetical protein
MTGLLASIAITLESTTEFALDLFYGGDDKAGYTIYKYTIISIKVVRSWVYCPTRFLQSPVV